ncbi:translation elongation factor Ts [Rubrimonas cliftonensis]|uniref:Elongation factor Ts n=1 Tax=Rubrimonas cliftonensis TaxID=89524 RepID=A0A1H4FJX4_9RHOB|nr:translation elongation factor Ts [Rubrimonas cliftonensis]SEA97451.1 translation elongation factor Ts (EF-Ts) [Rubrimonas cliftonensis]
MAITAAQVKELRDSTGAGMMDAKKALTETDGDMEAAVDWLRAKGLAKAAKKSGRTAAEGLAAVATKGGVGVVVEVNSETDFVARNADFQSMVAEIAQVALGVEGDVEALKAAPMNGKTVAEIITDKVATIGENMGLRRFERVEADAVSAYVHNAVAPGMGKIGVLVAIRTGAPAAAAEIGRQVAMHVAATSPASLSEADLDPALVEREKQVLTEQARESGKPDSVIDKMIVGRMNKYFQEVCLLKQAFVINPDLTVEAAVAEAGKAVGTEMTVTSFARLAVGEGVEKEEEDFAAEVAKTLKG